MKSRENYHFTSCQTDFYVDGRSLTNSILKLLSTMLRS